MNIASIIDHTVLKATATEADVDQVCEEALQYRFASACIPPFYIPRAASFLQGSQVKVCTVIGFPFGYSVTAAKAEEMKQAIAEGAQELDMEIGRASCRERGVI